MSKYLITSALPYCNNVPHLGNLIGSTLSGDVLARFKRQQGDNVLYLCGVDCYGTATEVKARQENISCKELCEKYGKLHKSIYDWFNINFDVWGTTNTDTQTTITHEIFWNLYKNNFIEEKTNMQLYCPTCDMFLADRYLKGMCYHPECCNKKIITNGDQCDACQKLIDTKLLIEPYCFLCKTPPVWTETSHLYLQLGKLADMIEEYNDRMNIPDGVKSIIKGWLKTGLESRCITRDLKWGTPVPLKGYENKVFYVWFDAPIGYYSILKHAREDWSTWLSKDTKWIQCYSKDNVVFHTIIFVGTVLGSGMNLPSYTDICAAEYLLYEGEKFSKSNNTGIFGNQVENLSNRLGITADYWRFYLIKTRPEAHDSSFDWKHFISTVNGDLVNTIGNFINRCVSMSDKYCQNQTIYEPDEKIVALVTSVIDKYKDAFNNYRFREALQQCLEIGYIGNGYLQTEKPWTLAKAENNELVLKNKLGTANMICLILIELLCPIIPTTCTNLKTVFLPENTKFSISAPNKIIIDLTSYNLAFKQLDGKEIKQILENLEIKSCL